MKDSLIELITQTSTNLPPDVRAAMGVALEAEDAGTQAAQALGIIATNIDMAQEDAGPICQDTGMPTFVVHTPVGVNQIAGEARDSRSRGGGHAARQAAAQFGGFADRKKQRRQSGRRDAGDSFRAVGSRTRSK